MAHHYNSINIIVVELLVGLLSQISQPRRAMLEGFHIGNTWKDLMPVVLFEALHFLMLPESTA